MSENWQGLVVVSRYFHPLDARTQADLDRILLESAGVRAVLVNAIISTLLPNQTIAFGGVKLAVRAEDGAAARELLQEDAAPAGLAPVRLARAIYYWAIRIIPILILVGCVPHIWSNALNIYNILDLAVFPAVAAIALLLVRKARQVEKKKEKTE